MDGNGHIFEYGYQEPGGSFPMRQPVPAFQDVESQFRYPPAPVPQVPEAQIPALPPAIFSYWWHPSQLRKMVSEQHEDEHAELQRLSNDYTPDYTGPLIGQRTPTSAVAQEFANAAPEFTAQSLALNREYVFIRPSRGDGNCGWRAVPFVYMELLVRLRDRQKIFDEIAHLTSLNSLLDEMGYEETVYEDFVNVTTELLRDLADAVDPDALLLERFNYPEISNAVIVHLRMITSVWMRKHADKYQPYLVDQTVDEYCSMEIDPFQREIEHLGIDALFEILIKPAGFALDIVNLDRSAGQQLSVHRFEPTNDYGMPAYANPPTIRLLFRPGHYDIIYKAEDFQASGPMQSTVTEVQVRLAHRFPETNNWMSHGQYVLSEDMPFRVQPHQATFADPVDVAIVNVPYATGSLGSFDTPYSDTLNTMPTTSHMPAAVHIPCGTGSLVSSDTSYRDILSECTPAMPPTSFVPLGPNGTIHPTSGYQVPLRSTVEPTRLSTYQEQFSSGISPTPALMEDRGPFRPSTYQYQFLGANRVAEEPPLQTVPMRDSHLNRIHHENDQFQPEQWTPQEGGERRSKQSGSRQRSTRSRRNQ